MSESETKVKPFTPQEMVDEIQRLENLVHDLAFSDRSSSWLSGRDYNEVAIVRDWLMMARSALGNAAFTIRRLSEGIHVYDHLSWSHDDHINHYDGQREVNITDLADETEHAANWEVG